MTEDYLADLQAATVSNPFDQAVTFRHQQNWLSNGLQRAAGVTYIPPPPGMLADLMEAFMDFANVAPLKIDPLIAASLASFGFVFLHPFMDGNISIAYPTAYSMPWSKSPARCWGAKCRRITMKNLRETAFFKFRSSCNYASK